jgi:hypothetical protein
MSCDLCENVVKHVSLDFNFKEKIAKSSIAFKVKNLKHGEDVKNVTFWC